MFRKGSIEDETLELVYNASERYEGEMAREILEQAGIPAVLADREDSGQYLRILGVGSPFGVDVLVRRDQAQRAKQILEEALSEEKGISDEELEALALGEEPEEE